MRLSKSFASFVGIILSCVALLIPDVKVNQHYYRSHNFWYMIPQMHKFIFQLDRASSRPSNDTSKYLTDRMPKIITPDKYLRGIPNSNPADY